MDCASSAGARALPYEEMLKRQEKLAFYSRLALVSKMTSLYGKRKHAHNCRLLGPGATGKADSKLNPFQYAFPVKYDDDSKNDRTLLLDIEIETLVLSSVESGMVIASVRLEDVWELSTAESEVELPNAIVVGLKDGAAAMEVMFDGTGPKRQFVSVMRYIMVHYSKQDEDVDDDDAEKGDTNDGDGG
eukprot:1280290-Rhodomonas_salina.4